MIRLSTLLFTFLLATQPVIAQSGNKPIGVFDSGTGGLTVLEAILRLDAFNNSTGKPGADGKPDFQEEHFHYLADQANMPYGNYAAEGKTDLLKEQILRSISFLVNDTQYSVSQLGKYNLLNKDKVKMMVVACNTATAYALPEIKQFVNNLVPVVGVIDAGCKAALEYQRKYPGTVGIFATVGTVSSNGYPNTLQKMAKEQGLPPISVVSQGGYGLAESIDRDWSFIADSSSKPRADYKGPSLLNSQYKIDTALNSIYSFERGGYSLLCEYDDKGSCTDMQLNDPVNYVRYHLVSLLEKMRVENYTVPLNTLILGCTHYPYLRDTIASVLKELYEVQTEGKYRYRNVLASKVELIDPAIETAKEAYLALINLPANHRSPIDANPKLGDHFFIAIPNKDLSEIQLQNDGWFTYQYKYGREAGKNKKYVQYVPFDEQNISLATYERFSLTLPITFKRLRNAVVLKDAFFGKK
ncbi:MAG: glutamate racemase [Chitinophagaceae bacterium]